MKKVLSCAMALIALVLTTATQAMVEQPVAGVGALIGSSRFDLGSQSFLTPGFSSDSVASTRREPDDRAVNLGLRRSALDQDVDTASAGDHRSCRQGDRGRLIRSEKVASYPTAASVRDYFYEWITFYQDFYQFPPDIPVSFNYGFAELPPNSRALLRPSYYADVTTNPQNPLRVRLRQNAVDQWRPHAPLRIYHSPDDEEVPYEDALVSVDRLRGRGAYVTVEPLPGFDHVSSWIQAMPRAVNWFRSLD